MEGVIVSPKSTFKTRTYYLAECDCGWTEDGYRRSTVERKLHRHAVKHPDTVRRLTRSVTFVWKPKEM